MAAWIKQIWELQLHLDQHAGHFKLPMDVADWKVTADDGAFQLFACFKDPNIKPVMIPLTTELATELRDALDDALKATP